MKKQLLTMLAASAMLFACNKQGGDLASNPLISPEPMYMNAPDFSKIKAEHFGPAFEAGFEQHTKEIDSIANNPDAPTFENTIEALEKSGEILNRTNAIFSALTSADTNDDLRALEADIAPRLAAHSDAMYLNDALFQRIKTVYESGVEGLEEDAKRLTKLYFDNFVKAGANLSVEDKEELKKINKEEAELVTKFGNILTDATNVPVLFESREMLDGLSDQEIEEASKLAKENNASGKYMLRIVNTTQQPVMTKLNNRDARKAMLEASVNRCSLEDANNTHKIILRIAQLRAQKAKLLGFESYAAWTLQDKLGKDPQTVKTFLANLTNLYRPKADADAKMIEEFARQTMGADFQLEAYDWEYFAEKLRKEKYDVDGALLSEYFELNNVLHKGVFYMAEKLYGLSFEERKDIPVYHEDVTVYDVKDASGEAIALFYFDPYARPSKSGGAWMSNFVEQSTLLGNKPVVYNVCNYKKPAKGESCLLSWDEVTTLFHEFGHGLHGMLSEQKYPSLAGTNVPRDFVEVPSQFNEHWADHPEIFANFAIHHKTGEAMPQELRDKMKAAASFNQAYSLGENLASSTMDILWHSISSSDNVTDLVAFQNDQLEKANLRNNLILPRYGSPYFRHIWSNGYASGYYSYLWSEAIDNEIYDWVMKNGGLTRENGDRLRQYFYGAGNSRDIMQSFQEFTGHAQVDIEPLLRARGLR